MFHLRRSLPASTACLTLLLGVCLAASATPLVLHVASNGSDQAAGTAKAPFRSLTRARDAIRVLKAGKGLPEGGVRVLVHNGVYRLAQPFALTPADSGTAKAPVVYAAATGARPVLSGGRVITGLRRVNSGHVRIKGVDATNHSPLSIIKAGVGHIPQDRASVGAVGDMSVSDNLAMKGYRSRPLSLGFFLLPKKFLELAKKMIASFKIATTTPETHVKFLSGGNIQKVIMARELSRNPKILLAAQPTRGVDIGASEYIHQRLLEQRATGMGILLISEDLDETRALSDRIAVIYEGKIMG
ncbi:MAG: ATP-binding cassette domain-containing protein, partial [Armatimonadota bacterium]